MEAENDSLFRTANMAMAAFLSFEMPIKSVEWRDGTCFWFFTKSTQLNELVTAFQGGAARVDPRAYSYKLTQMRKDMRGKLSGKEDDQ